MKNIKIENKTLVQFFKFMVIGIIAVLIDYSVMIIFKELFYVSVLVSSALGFLVALVFNYVCNMKYVFVDLKEGMTRTKAAIIFLLTSLIGLGFNQIIMFVLTEKLLIYYIIAKIVSIALVGVWNFVSKKIIIEK